MGDDASLDTDGVAATPPLEFGLRFADIAGLATALDFVSVTWRHRSRHRGEEYSAHPRYPGAGQGGGRDRRRFRALLMVSNHTFDRGMSAFMATVERFALIGVSQHGMAVSLQDARAHLEDVDGAVIGHLSYSYGWDVDQRPCDEPWRSALIDPDLVIADTGGARDRDAVVVVGRVIGGTRGRRMRRLSNVRWRNV